MQNKTRDITGLSNRAHIKLYSLTSLPLLTADAVDCAERLASETVAGWESISLIIM